MGTPVSEPLFSIKLQVASLKCFYVNFGKAFRSVILKSTCGRLLNMVKKSTDKEALNIN